MKKTIYTKRITHDPLALAWLQRPHCCPTCGGGGAVPQIVTISMFGMPCIGAQLVRCPVCNGCGAVVYFSTN